ncbi:heparan-alpha-glucosaminide N-acetyltransferase domain-containing protein [Microbacterium sp. 179-I 3D2 NHS]|uniref:heparan-alpha-glucosaminide N-acetyltransferase domain-containing protein n=1 Tax=Microbacterium sp. 179-I 3D2 NHS TaxID=3235178 RepID=UPI0039A247C9
MTTVLPPTRWVREFGRPPRILGLDVARALAILGMVGAHVGETSDFDAARPETWADLVNGRSSLLFALLAGVSIALMTGRRTPPAPERMPAVRLGLVGRGAAIFVIGLALEMLNTPIAVILTLYGLLYVAVIPFLRWRPWQLLAGSAALALVAPALFAFLGAAAEHPSGAGIGFVLFGSYPITVWMALVLAGMAIGRIGADSLRTAVVALVVGVVLAAAGYGLGAAGGAAGIPASLDAAPGADPGEAAVVAVFAVEPHSGGTAEVLGSGGFVLAVLALCLLVSRPLRWLLLPLGALGSMPLTAYSAHVLSIVLVVGPGGYLSSNAFWGETTIVLLLLTTLWSVFFGRGPLERLVARSAAAMSAVSRR